MRQRPHDAFRPALPAALALVVTALALVAAGCGGGSKTAATTAAPATAAPATTEQATTTQATTRSQVTTSELSGLASAANCRQLADLSTKFMEAAGGTEPQDIQQVAQLLREFAAKTPSDVRPDFKVLSDAYSKLADAFVGVKPGAVPTASTLAKLQKLAGEIDTARLTTASENISAWLRKNCAP